MAIKSIIGRTDEQQILSEALKTPEAELITIFGRRRVGKTYLIRKYYEKNMIFEFSGVHDAKLKDQLTNFRNILGGLLNQHIAHEVPESWTTAFEMLKKYAAPLLKKGKKVIFFDEFPWLSSARSGFLSAFEYFWNSWASRQDNLIVVICGSAASWMIQKIVNNRGGLHNRITRKIRLLPFNLAETEAYLKSRQINLDQYQITMLYMAMGGIPQYLKDIRPGQSAAQNIDRMCFAKDGILKEEFKNLYHSLFAKADKHMAIVKALAERSSGMTRKEVIAACRLTTGGTTTLLLEELAESGFISAYLPFEKTTRESVYKLSDEFSRFHLKFLENARATGDGTWLRLSAAPTWRSWSGTAFESVCMKHTRQIKKALGISGVYTEESIWRHAPKRGKGAQIDLLLDRADFCISLCEMKFSTTTFTIDKGYAEELKNKVAVFMQDTKTKKTPFFVMVTTYGTKDNQYKTGLIQNEVKLNDLFL
ncbi:AAA family ATPase [Sphingobacterium bambusae]|uniref:ATP-binding protein n=1 Tax=Sphingobacterium bambusae TaxID=662858 RepID=A0ABW6BD98_9SPHI|nr:ATP-binding protein [Sphingobacterium bambusae]WPL46825.1 ATP-binding protein [Sphingobacterium bambusae]